VRGLKISSACLAMRALADREARREEEPGRAVYLQILEAVPPLPLATGTSNFAVTILL